ncbi:MAG: phosphoribosylglycinamide formyltransferase [Pseudomonadota bacterium]
MSVRLAILLSGRGSNMLALVEACRAGVLRGVCEPCLVLSSDPEASGLDRAAALGVPTIALPARGLGRAAYDEALAEALAPFEPDCIALAGFMRILGPRVLSRWAGRVVNIHPADTRQHQGLHGYAWAWERRLAETAVTVHLVDAGLDTGPILAQRAVDLRGVGSLEEVEARGLAVEHEVYAEALRDLLGDTVGNGDGDGDGNVDAQKRREDD